MNKLISTILLAIAITGCSEQVNNWELKAANKFCQDKGSEVDYLTVHEAHSTAVICVNGSWDWVEANNK